MEIEPAEMGEVDEIADRWVALADGQRAYHSHILPEPNRGAVREGLAGHVVSEGLLVARDPEVVGFVSFGPETDGFATDVDRGVVENIFVVPERRGEGIGTALLTAAEDRLREAGADAVSLEVMADNAAARRFYERHGYAPHRVELEKEIGPGESDTDSREDE